jgi:hypothetical protein
MTVLADPNGTLEDTVAAKRPITLRDLLPTAIKPCRTKSSNRNGSGPADLGRAVQRRRQRDLTHRGGDVVGGHRLDQHRGARTVSPSIASAAMRVANSKNCVACTLEYGTDELPMSFSSASFALM